MHDSYCRLAISVSLACLASGCAMGPKAALEIRSIDQSTRASSELSSIEHGKVLLGRGQYADAISAFRTALREESVSAEAHNGLAIAYDAIGRKDLARRYFELAVAEKPGEVRYRRNLASFFEGNGQPELAFGLRDAPVGLATAEIAIAAPYPQAIEELPIISEAAKAVDIDPMAAILKDLSPRQVDQESVPLAAFREPRLNIVPLSNKNLVPHVLRPAATPMIKAVQISLPSLPKPPPQRPPLEGKLELIADLPRNDRRLAAGSSPYIERVSLGEVKLVTVPLKTRNELAFDFDKLGPKLALWAADEARQAELRKTPGLQGRFAIQNAIKRAAADAGASKSTSLAAVALQLQRDFVYLAYDAEENIADTQA